VHVGTQVGHGLSGCRQAGWSPSESAQICRGSEGKSAGLAGAPSEKGFSESPGLKERDGTRNVSCGFGFCTSQAEQQGMSFSHAKPSKFNQYKFRIRNRGLARAVPTLSALDGVSKHGAIFFRRV
jgi:hypothetical protein